MGLRIGVIGAGAISEAHLLAFSENRDVDSIMLCDMNEQACQDKAEKYEKVSGFFLDYRKLLQDKSIDIVDICLPHYLHCPVAVEALNSGKDVICEKPIALTLEEADEMIETARENGKRLFIEMNQRFMPAHIKAKELLEQDTLGKPFLAVFNIMGNEFTNMNNPKHWKGDWKKAGGGVLIDTGYHAIYVMLHFFGKPKAVTGVAKRLLVEPENKADDNTVAILEFDNSLLGTIAISYTILSEPWNEKRHIYGTEGSIHIDDNLPQPLTLVQNNQPQVIKLEQTFSDPGSYYLFSVKSALHHFIDCYMNDKDPKVTAEEAKDALQIALAIYQSSREGRRIEIK